jgi:phage terminase large subunit-like protein
MKPRHHAREDVDGEGQPRPAWQSIILEKKLRHGDHPVLKFCASNCVVKRDAAGNKKLEALDRPHFSSSQRRPDCQRSTT